MQVPYGPLAPDQGASALAICLVAEGVIPRPEGYGPAPTLVTPGGADALPDDPRGAITCIKRDGATAVFFLTETTLYLLENDYTWTEIANTFSCTGGDDWSCEQFGDKLLFTNTTDGLQAYDIEAGGAVSYISAAGDPREIFICANMVFGLDCKDNSGTRDNRLIRNSDFNDHTKWSGGAADTQPLEGGGELVCGFALKNNAAVIIQAHALRLLQFGNAGGSALYSLQEVSNWRGSASKKATVSFDGAVYGLSTDGFFRFSLERGLEFIGHGYVDDAFINTWVVLSRLKEVQGAIDPSRKIVVWRYPSDSDASSTVFENIIGFAWAYENPRWFTWLADTSYLSRLATSGYTLTTWESAFTDLAGSPNIGIGDRFWQGGGQFLAALGADLKIAGFSGTNQAARVRTSAQNSPVTGLIQWATGIDDAPGTLTLGVTQSLAEQMTFDPAKAASKVSAGRFPLRGRGLNIAFERSVPAGETWTELKGIDHIKASTGGPK